MAKPAKKTKTKNKVEKVVFKKLPSAWKITKDTAKLIWLNKKAFLTITLTYGFLNLLLVKGFSGSTNVSDLKAQLSDAFSGSLGSLGSGLGVFVVLLGSSGNTSSAAGGAYQLFLGIFTSLAIIWMLRQLLQGASVVRVKDAFYNGMYPIVPFIGVLLVVGLQFIPMLIGSSIYSIVISNGIAVHVYEKLIWFLVFIVLSGVTFYFISSSLIALYIVTLPNMTPIKALRSAKELVKGRRLLVIRKVLWLPLALLIGAAVIMLPIIIFLTPLAQWVFFLLTMFGLVAVHAYMYGLYRELLGE